MLLGHTRISPPPPAGLYPFLTAAQRDPHDLIAHVSFVPQRLATGGAFYDFTARYGAVREQDRVTLREWLQVVDDTLAEALDLRHLLDLPLVALSNGQTRRARILRALMRTPPPQILLLTEPLSMFCLFCGFGLMVGSWFGCGSSAEAFGVALCAAWGVFAEGGYDSSGARSGSRVDYTCRSG